MRTKGAAVYGDYEDVPDRKHVLPPHEYMLDDLEQLYQEVRWRVADIVNTAEASKNTRLVRKSSMKLLKSADQSGVANLEQAARARRTWVA